MCHMYWDAQHIRNGYRNLPRMTWKVKGRHQERFAHRTDLAVSKARAVEVGLQPIWTLLAHLRRAEHLSRVVRGFSLSRSRGIASPPAKFSRSSGSQCSVQSGSPADAFALTSRKRQSRRRGTAVRGGCATSLCEATPSPCRGCAPSSGRAARRGSTRPWRVLR
jgi:hypothetical protein